MKQNLFISDSLKIRLAGLFASLLFSLFIYGEALGQSNNDPSTLKPYLSCEFEDGLKIVETFRHRQWTFPEKYRTVMTDEGMKNVSLIDGYKIMVAYPKTYYFANIKAEQSNPQDYGKDKETLIENLRHAISTSKEMETTEPIKLKYDGFEGYGASRKRIFGNVLGTYVLFSDANQQVLTVYFLNQPSEKRKFQTIEEYRTLRDRFFERFTGCIKGNSNRR